MLAWFCSTPAELYWRPLERIARLLLERIGTFSAQASFSCRVELRTDWFWLPQPSWLASCFVTLRFAWFCSTPAELDCVPQLRTATLLPDAIGTLTASALFS